MYSLGTVQPRISSGADPVQVTGAPTGHSRRHGLSLDNALFPFLHPGGCGAYDPADSLSTLLKQRIQQLFSPFTLCKEYLLVMFRVNPQLKCAVLVCKCTIVQKRNVV
jgi:hypothetical protein